MSKDGVSRLLDEFSAVTTAAPRPISPARRLTMRNRLPVATLTGATLVIVAVAVAAIVLGRPGPSSTVGSSPSTAAASPAPSAPAPSAPASVTAVVSPPATAAPTARPTIGPCDPASLTARIKSWEGAAGSRIATVELTNRGTASCVLDALDRPQLLGGDGSVRIDGQSPATTDQLTLKAGAVVTTLVEASNDCKPAPVPPITLAFVFADGQRLVAEPLSPTDTTDPPCNGAGSPGTIDMHPWAP